MYSLKLYYALKLHDMIICRPSKGVPSERLRLARPWRKWGQKRPQGGKWRKNATKKIKKNKSS